jgi:caa(3)-type oxidase subunit IV
MSSHEIAHNNDVEVEGIQYDSHTGEEVLEHKLHHVESSKKEIWKVFFILLAITVLEFLVALVPGMRENIGKYGTITIFFGLTILKAFYIVAFFMHLKHEKLNLAYTIIVPLLFIIYLIALLLFEGSNQPVY